MRVHVVLPQNRRRALSLPAVPRAGDVLWMDSDPPLPSMRKYVVRNVEWFERYIGEKSGAVVTVELL